MADIFDLTGGVVRLTGTGKQPLYLALDVSAYDEADVRLWVVSLEGAGNVDIRLLTGMEKDGFDGFVELVAFSNVSTSNKVEKKNAKGMLRYIVWEVSNLTANAVTFRIDGMLRKW